MIQEAIEEVSKGQDLSRELMHRAMEEIMDGKADTREIISFLTHLSSKGETAQELTVAAQVMRQRAILIKTKHKVILDTCGTGADQLGTFNVSTAAAFVAAGSGICVAKHGNRSVSGRCGSADILEALGVNIHLSREKIEQCLDEIGIAFLFAQDLHPAMKAVNPARREIGKRTLFNLLGPLTNPAGATHQLVGVFDRRWIEIMAEALVGLGAKHILVVRGEDGLDEISTTNATSICEGKIGSIRNFQVVPEDFGFERRSLKDLAGGDAEANAKDLIDILKGASGPKQDIVLLNAGAAIYAAEKAGSIKEGVELARRSIDSGKAMEKLSYLKEASH